MMNEVRINVTSSPSTVMWAFWTCDWVTSSQAAMMTSGTPPAYANNHANTSQVVAPSKETSETLTHWDPVGVRMRILLCMVVQIEHPVKWFDEELNIDVEHKQDAKANVVCRIRLLPRQSAGESQN